ncbi:MAG: GNAT family N-acetyltransferase [Lachnospiraceae bacterium]|jgi:GNAT superfamily N-acetyltransferase|nr:GNAT family N-acetyltransferase [Lachnospiraceae bacterium]
MEITNFITAKEYLGMRESVGWSVFPEEEAQMGLNNSYVVCIRDNDKPAAMGRIVWDHGYAVLIADVIVAPEYQGRGLGRLVMETIMNYIKEQLKPGYRIMVSLLAAHGKEDFYKKFGFIERPNESFGPGMHQWLEN